MGNEFFSFAVKFEIQSFGPSIVRVKNVETGKFLAINSKGILQTRVSNFDKYWKIFYTEDDLVLQGIQNTPSPT